MSALPAYNGETLDLIEQFMQAQARDSFLEFRRYMRPRFVWGWFQIEYTQHLQQFYEDYLAGRRPILVIQAPPQHGKSMAVIDFVAWIVGKHPELRAIFASFSERLGIRANSGVQRHLDSPKYSKIFPDTKLSPPGSPVIDGSRAARNNTMLEFVGHEGSFRNVTVNGAINGESLDLGLIDDPIKGRAEASSERVRDQTWDWFTDDWFTRFSEMAGMLVVMTRWHVDDPVGRLLEAFGDRVKLVTYSAIAENDEPYRDAGEPLFPEIKSMEFLMERKMAMASFNWEALYQQRPRIVGGELIRGVYFGRYTTLPLLKYRMIYSDTAQKTGERNDYSVFSCWGLGKDGNLYLLDLVRGKWEAPELKRRAIDFWNKHRALNGPELGNLRKMKIEDKASGTGLVQQLRSEGHVLVEPIPREKDKYTRCLDILGYIENGRVFVPENAPFVSDFIAEVESFTADDSHLHDDQTDTLMDAVQDMLDGNKIDVWSRL